MTQRDVFIFRVSAEAHAHPAGDGEQLTALGDVAGLTGDVLEAVGDDAVVDHGDGDAVALHFHQLRGVAAELGGQYAVIGAGAAPRCIWPGMQTRVSIPVFFWTAAAMRLVAVTP